MSKNEVFKSLKLQGFTGGNVPPVHSVLQISNFYGKAEFLNDLTCTGILADSSESHSGQFSTLLADTVTTDTASLRNAYTSKTDICGSLFCETIRYYDTYLYATQGVFQQIKGLQITSISGWQKILEPTGIVDSPTNDLAEIITSVNSLLQIFADRGIIRISVPSITDFSVDISGVNLIWTGGTSMVRIDSILYASGVQSPLFLPLTQSFYSSFTVGGSSPLLVSLVNIDSNPQNEENYYPFTSPSAYFRANDLNSVNYILISTELFPYTSGSTYDILGSNASVETPIGFIFYSIRNNSSAYISIPYFITDPGSHTLLYNYALDTWSLT